MIEDDYCCSGHYMTPNLHKSTSAYYGEEYQTAILGHHETLKVAGSYEQRRLEICEQLVNTHLESFLQNKARNEITVVDIGCSVGTYAIHFSKQGFNSIGIDFDEAAIRAAVKLNSDEGGSARFMKGDVAALRDEIGEIDIAVCMDIFEHLHDDEIGALFYSLKERLSEEGCLIFHTLPLEFDYLFWHGKKGIIQFPILLRPFKWLSSSIFSRLVKIYAAIYDIGLICIFDKTHRQYIKRFDHCNPLTEERMLDIFERAGYQVKCLKSGFVSDQFRSSQKKYFLRHPITHRSLSGIAYPLAKNPPDPICESR